MSNPGVIKLVQSIYNGHNFWMDDNIGESIHIHLDQFRVNLTVNEFNNLADELETILTCLIKIEGLDIAHLDKRFLNYQLEDLLDAERAYDENVKLSSLTVFDDSGACYLPDCLRVKALRDNFKQIGYEERATNFWGQSNKERMETVLSSIMENDYPQNGNLIMVEAERHIILDGWHRAACLYYLYGDIEIPVKMIKINSRNRTIKKILPIHTMKKVRKVALYGAGVNGINLRKQIEKFGYELSCWCDRRYSQIGEIGGDKIISPTSLNMYDYDCVVVSVMDELVQKEIEVFLINECQVQPEKISFV